MFEQWVSVRSKDGSERGWDAPRVRVTRFQLDEKETAAGVFQQGGGEINEGLLCIKDNKWTHIKDEQICDKTKDCKTGLDEKEGICQPVLVTGSNTADGV